MSKATSQPAQDVAVLDFVSPTDTAAGFEDISMDTMAIPFIQILQKGSPQVNKQKPEYIAGAEAGMFYNSVTKKVYGAAIDVIVLSFQHIYTEWKPNRGGFVARHTFEEGERLATDRAVFGKFKTAEGNDLIENYVYFVLVVGHEAEGAAVMSLASSNIGAAKTWNRLMVSTVMPNGKKALPHWLVFHVATVYAENDKGDWFKLDVKGAGYVNKGQYEIVTPERMALPGRSVDYAQIDAPKKEDIPF